MLCIRCFQNCGCQTMWISILARAVNMGSWLCSSRFVQRACRYETVGSFMICCVFLGVLVRVFIYIFICLWVWDHRHKTTQLHSSGSSVGCGSVCMCICEYNLSAGGYGTTGIKLLCYCWDFIAGQRENSKTRQGERKQCMYTGRARRGRKSWSVPK